MRMFTIQDLTLQTRARVNSLFPRPTHRRRGMLPLPHRYGGLNVVQELTGTTPIANLSGRRKIGAAIVTPGHAVGTELFNRKSIEN